MSIDPCWSRKTREWHIELRLVAPCGWDRCSPNAKVWESDTELFIIIMYMFKICVPDFPSLPDDGAPRAARCFAQRPDVLLCDELLGGLDALRQPRVLHMLVRLMRETGALCTVARARLMAAHTTQSTRGGAYDLSTPEKKHVEGCFWQTRTTTHVTWNRDTCCFKKEQNTINSGGEEAPEWQSTRGGRRAMLA